LLFQTIEPTAVLELSKLTRKHRWIDGSQNTKGDEAVGTWLKKNKRKKWKLLIGNKRDFRLQDQKVAKKFENVTMLLM